MNEVLRTNPNTSEQIRRSREQVTFNMAEVAILALINPLELPKLVTTMAIDPNLEIKNLENEEELAKFS